MKKLLLALVILSTLVSCGKKNVASTGSSTSAINVANLPYSAQGVASDLGSRINANQFGVGQATYYETFAQLVLHAPNTTYSYGAVAAASQSSNPCHTVAYIITVCGYSSSSTSTSTATITRTVVHSSVDLLTKQNQLIAIINKTNQIQSLGNGVYWILTTDNVSYYIDVRYPIQANPVQTQTVGGVGETLVRVQ